MLTLAVLLLMSAIGSAAQEIVTSRAVIPVVGSVRGVGGIEWRSDVAIRNDLPANVEILMTLVSLPDEPFYFTTIPAGQTITFNNIVRDTFGLDGVLSPLVVQTFAPMSVTVGSIAYGIRGAELTEPQVIQAFYGNGIPHFQTLPSLARNDTFRTNIGISNLGDSKATIVMALQRVAGRNVAVLSMDIAPRSHMQLPLELFFPLIAESDGLALVVEQTGEVLVYGSVLANATSNGRFVAPR